MPSERIQRQIDALLDEATAAVSRNDWATVRERAEAALRFDPENEDARAYLEAASPPAPLPVPGEGSLNSARPEPVEGRTPAQPESFVGGRYHVRKFLGEGGKKKVFLAHDESLDRDVAFALIKTEGLDATGRERIVREAQAMGRLGAHPHVVTIFEIGEEAGAPYVVTELMGGGDIEGSLEKAGGPLPLEQSLTFAKGVCRGLMFAHAQGIVHRDLKPGNVWLTADGVAKIGDFGLAVNLGRSRLTQHGLMVGTVAYMPPEQALGGEVTPQSDLYSLGAMLYELVTGKPPFQADDPTAVISQHINTPPVAPSWNSDRCPPDLEALILRLLAKVPADRPANAAEVLAALEPVDPDAKSASHSDSQANPLDRLARGVFVGRERELERLRGAFDEAFAGHGSVVMLVGEPGIGKTRTTQELETYARMRGAQVFWGRADESAGAPPYRPWLQVARSYRDQNAVETRREEWGEHAVELQRIFPALRDLFPNLPAPPDTESEEGQYRLFEAMADFVRGVSARVPLLLVLDDLHWSDRATLQMLTHLAREIARSRILVLGTYRDTDLDRTHPLSAALAELNREQLFTRILLRGLDRDAVAHYIAATAHADPPARLVDRIFEETEGNPFFLSEVVNLMAQEGTLVHASNAYSDIAIPEGVKEALGRRLDRLSPEANQLLTLAAVAGREFTHELLVALTGQDDETVLRLVEEALAGRVIEETGVGAFRFRHALMQETLAGELSASRKVRVHGQIAEALELLYGAGAEANAAQLAQHYAESAVLNRAHAKAAVRYLRLAAEQAAAGLAWEEAARRYERCLALISDSADSLGEDEASLWAELALCERADQVASARVALDRALILYRERGDARAAAAAAVRFFQSFAGTNEARQVWPTLDRLLDALGDEDSEELCRLLSARAGHDFSAAGDVLAERATAMASRLGLSGPEFPSRLRIREGQALWQSGQFRTAAALQQSLALEVHGESYLVVENNRAASLLFAGEIDAALAVLSDLAESNRRLRRSVQHATVSAGIAAIAWQRGESERFRALAANIPMGLSAGADLMTARVTFDRGELADALALVPRNDHPNAQETVRIAGHALRAGILLAMQERGSAHAELGQSLEHWAAGDSFTERSLTLSNAGGALCELAEESFVDAATEFLTRFPDLRCFATNAVWIANPDVLRGALALRLGRVDEAEQHFRTGLEWASRSDVRFVIDQGRCHQGLAEVAERRSDHASAMEQLDAAGELFARYGAKLYLDQVLAKKQFLKA